MIKNFIITSFLSEINTCINLGHQFDKQQDFLYYPLQIMYKITPEIIKRYYPLLSYCIIGGFNTIFSFALFTLFWRYFDLNYLLATSCTYAITACIQFFANRKVSFKCTSGNIHHQIIKYLMMLGTNYLVTISIMHFNVAILKLSPYIGMCMSTVCTATMSFILFKFWIFKHHITV